MQDSGILVFKNWIKKAKQRVIEGLSSCGLGWVRRQSHLTYRRLMIRMGYLSRYAKVQQKIPPYKAVRLRQGIAVYHAAQAMCVPVSTLHLIEKGIFLRTGLQGDYLVKIMYGYADFLGISRSFIRPFVIEMRLKPVDKNLLQRWQTFCGLWVKRVLNFGMIVTLTIAVGWCLTDRDLSNVFIDDTTLVHLVHAIQMQEERKKCLVGGVCRDSLKSVIEEGQEAAQKEQEQRLNMKGGPSRCSPLNGLVWFCFLLSCASFL